MATFWCFRFLFNAWEWGHCRLRGTTVKSGRMAVRHLCLSHSNVRATESELSSPRASFVLLEPGETGHFSHKAGSLWRALMKTYKSEINSPKSAFTTNDATSVDSQYKLLQNTPSKWELMFAKYAWGKKFSPWHAKYYDHMVKFSLKCLFFFLVSALRSDVANSLAFWFKNQKKRIGHSLKSVLLHCLMNSGKQVGCG